MTPSCQETHAWLARQGTGLGADDFQGSALHAAHLQTCSACASLQRRAEGLLVADRESLAYISPPSAELRFLAAAQRTASQPPKQRLWPAFLAAALVVVAVGIGTRPAPVAVPMNPTVAPPSPEQVVAAPTNPEVPAVTASPVPAAPAAAETAPSSHFGVVQIDGRPVARGAVVQLHRGLDVATEAASGLVVRDADNAVLTVRPQTRFAVQEWSRELTRLALTLGTVEAEVDHRRPGERFEILTENARVVVVGTVFSVAYQPGEGTTVDGESGTVRVEHLDGELIGLVRGGEHLVVPPGSDTLTADERVRNWLAAGDDQAAIDYLSAQPTRTWTQEALLADAYALAGDHRAAEKSYRRAIADAESPPERLFFDLARLQRDPLRDLGGEAATWEHFLTVHPNGSARQRALLAVGEYALAKGDSVQAEERLTAILEGHSGPETDRALAHLGALWIAQERWEPAERALSRYVGENSERGETALVGLARVDIAKGRLGQAARRLSTWEERFPEGRRALEVSRLREVIANP